MGQAGGISPPSSRAMSFSNFLASAARALISSLKDFDPGALPLSMAKETSAFSKPTTFSRTGLRQWSIR
jgi:hypothetical protein